MLFNSFEFIFLFLPVAVAGFFLLAEFSPTRSQLAAVTWLVLASFFFYAWWNPVNLGLLAFSILFNYLVGYVLRHELLVKAKKKLLLIAAIAVNLALIAYFKYANFFVDNVNYLFHTSIQLSPIVLPLAISFFTFVQITYLVDAYQGETKEDTFLNYCLFVTFFPHLIAGPIVHHKDLMPQFADRSIYRFNGKYLAIGLTIFAMGLFKKVIFADSIAVYASQVFAAADRGTTLSIFEAWVGALAYTLQLYFDFSGYSDMAIGAAYLFGIKLPLNFNSPYKSVNIIDFWRRWHITLSNFLRDYLYIPLGGSRKGKVRRHLNLMITMLLGGLWHGAGWTFVLWGGLHGLYLVINHQWRSIRRSVGNDLNQSHWFSRTIACLLTFIAVVISWVLFRAKTLDAAVSVLRSMFGLNGISLPRGLATKLEFLQDLGLNVQFNGLTNSLDLKEGTVIASIAVLLLIVWFTPNTQQWMGEHNPITLESEEPRVPKPLLQLWQKLQWRPSYTWAIASATFTVIALLNLTRVSEFLYFQF